MWYSFNSIMEFTEAQIDEFRQHGLKGAKLRAMKTTASQRIRSAKIAAQARWKGHIKKRKREKRDSGRRAPVEPKAV